MNNYTPYLIFSFFTISLLILFYSLNVRKKSVSVSALFLWEGTREVNLERPFLRRFYRERLFYLHLAILLALLSTLVLHSFGNIFVGSHGQRIIFIMDTSASMKTVEGKKTRLDLAKEKAVATLKNFKRPNVMILTAGSEARTILPFTTDSDVIRKTIHNLESGDTGSNIQDTILTLRSYNSKDTKTFVISDGAIEGFSTMVNDNPALSFISVGNADENIAVTDLKIYDERGMVATLIRNYYDNPVQTTVDLSLNGMLVDVKQIEIPAGGLQAVTFRDVPLLFGNLGVKVNYPDSFPYDNLRYAIHSAPLSLSILLVTRGNYFLKQLLDQVNDHSITVMEPVRYEVEVKSVDVRNDYDIVIYDNYTPSASINAASIYINPDHAVKGISWDDGYAAPKDLYALREHPVMHYTDFSDVKIQKARLVKSFKGITLLESTQSPLIIASELGGKKRIFIGFDLEESDFPLSVNFPVFFSNLLSWFDPYNEHQDSITSGDTFIKRLPERFKGSKKTIIRLPDGRVEEININNGIINFSHTNQAGIYKVIFENGEIDFAVNINTSESNIRPYINKSSLRNQKDMHDLNFMPNLKAWKILGILALFLLFYEGKIRAKTDYRIWNS